MDQYIQLGLVNSLEMQNSNQVDSGFPQLLHSDFSVHKIFFLMEPDKNRRFSLFDEEEDAMSGAIHLRIISTSDVYELGNWPRVVTALKELRLPAGDGNHNVFLIPGDFLAPSVISFVDQGESMVDCMNKVGVELCTFGNHESDVRMSELGARIRESKFTWINSNMTGLPDCVPQLPEYVKLDLVSSTQKRRVALLGLLTDDKYLYRQGAFGGAKIKPVAETALRLHAELAPEVDIVIPLTHQSMMHDRHIALISAGRFPVIIGAHDHSPFTETVAGVPIIKAGMDAINLAITDIVWGSPSTPKESPDVSISLVAMKRFEPNEELAKIVKDHQTRVLSSLDAACVVPLTKGVCLTSHNIRVAQRTAGTMITSLVRDSLLGDCCMLASGSIRRGFDYPSDHLMFTYRDLVSELPFEDDVVVVNYPGSVIEEGLKFSRGPLRKGMGGFLQVDSGMELDENENILRINGEPFDRNREYRLVTNILALEGIDDNVPLIKHFNRPCIEGGCGGLGPREGNPRRLPLKAALQTVICRRKIVSICSSKRQKNDAAGVTKEEFANSLPPSTPGWYIDQLFSLVDWDCDGFLGFTDLAIANVFCWLSGRPSGVEVDDSYRIDPRGIVTREELEGHLDHVFPRNVVSSIMSKLCKNDDTMLVTRADVMPWLDALKLQ